MSFAFTPDDKPSRLIRYVEPGALSEGLPVVALLDGRNNVLRVDRGLFAKLSLLDQRAVLRTHHVVTAMTPDGTLVHDVDPRPSLAAE